MPKVLAPILPSAPQVSIVTSAQPLADGALADAFASGLSSRDSDFCLPVGGWPFCGPDSEDDTKVVPDGHTFAEFHPWTIYVPFSCDGGKVLYDEAHRSATEGLKVKTPYAVARELWTGSYSGSASLQSTAEDLSASAAQPARVVANALVSNFKDCTGGAIATLHVPSVLVDQLLVDGYAARSGDRILTATGDVVVPGPGYPSSPGNWGPLDSGGVGTASADGEAWMYVTGPVELGLGEVYEMGSDEVASGSFARLNRTEMFVERPAIFRFPTCCVFAARAALSVL